MNILHINTYTYKNNLSFPHYQYHQELLSLGENSYILSAKGDVIDDRIIILNRGILFPFFGISRLVRKMVFEFFFRNKRYYFFPEWNLDCITFKQIRKKLPVKPDVIFTYWTKFAFNQKLLYKLSEYYDAPVICVPPDMAPLTGGCHYSGDCVRYQDSCGKCPILKSSSGFDFSFKTWKFKKKYIEKTNISLITSSHALYEQSTRSSLYKKAKIFKIQTSVDEEVFKPNNKQYARSFFDISEKMKVVFFGAASLKEERKGIKYFFEALEILKDIPKSDYTNEDVFLLIAGKNLDEIDIPFKYKHVGYLKTQKELSLAYQASDLFACSSIEDSGPLMINQAIMSGIPVVSFNMGVAPDLVFNKRTGYIAELKNSSDFALGLHEILSLDENMWQGISNNCRDLAINEYSAKDHPRKLLNVIKQVLFNPYD